MRNVIALVVLALVLHGGCKKADDADGEVTITGRMVKDCSLAPLAALRVHFYTYHFEGFGKQTFDELGYDTTDADGRFSITVPNANLENIAFVWAPTTSREDDRDILQSYRWPQKPEAGKTYDWGYIFFGGQVPVTRVNSNLHFDRTTFQNADSIFFGIKKAAPIAIGGAVRSYTYQDVVDPSVLPTSIPDSVYLTWATRRSAFDSSFQNYGANAAFKAKRVLIPRYPCEFGTTTDIYIK